MRGPYVNAKAVYQLNFGAFQIGTHLRLLGRVESEVRGLNADDMNLEALFCDPKEGHPDLKHNMEAAISPDFMGLSGRFTFKAKPEARLLPLVKAFGLKVDGVFTQDPGDVDDSSGWEVWERRRFVASSEQTDTIGEAGSWQPASVRVSFQERPSDELDPLGVVSAEVIARRGTLLEGDLMMHPTRGTYQVRGVSEDGDYEKARLEK